MVYWIGLLLIGLPTVAAGADTNSTFFLAYFIQTLPFKVIRYTH